MNKIIVLLLTACLFSANALAYGPRGHHLVGAIADKRLAKNKAVAAKVKKLLDGITLAEAATLPDEIKSWDGCNPKKKPSKKAVTNKTRINKELRAFWKANPCDGKPSHHVFHYTDVPVFGDEKYADGEAGRSKFDVVQMIPFCLRVLRGDEPEKNDRAITKAVAIILLTHYLGDIHQPLHVGAEFFNAAGKPFEPTDTNHGFEDQGGNKLVLFTFMDGKLKQAGRTFHGYWDGQTVEDAFGTVADWKVAQQLAQKQPSNWKLNGAGETWAEQMANDILPMAQEAHERLDFEKIKTQPGKHEITSGEAREKKKIGGTFYAVWAASIVKKEIHKGGWRLAALLEEVLE